MKIGYYPGCSLEASAKNYKLSLESIFRLLDVELVELPEWTCCGSSSGHSLDETLALLLAGENLSLAADSGLDLVVPCALCYNRLKHAQKAFAEGKIKGRNGAEVKVAIHDIAAFLASEEMLKRIREKVVHPLSDLKVVPYYGCQVDRPPKVTGSKEYENPRSMDRVLEALGAQVVDWSYKTTCCGGGLAVARRDILLFLVGKLFKRLAQTGADLVAVACQMCQANLDMYQDVLQQEGVLERPVPILYFTDLIGLALGDSNVGRFIRMNRVDPVPFLRQHGIAV